MEPEAPDHGCGSDRGSPVKYIGGHSDLIGGAVITNRDDLAERLNFLKTTTGAITSPFDALSRSARPENPGTADGGTMQQCTGRGGIPCPVTTRLKSILSGLKDHPQYELCKNRCAPAVPWSLFS